MLTDEDAPDAVSPLSYTQEFAFGFVKNLTENLRILNIRKKEKIYEIAIWGVIYLTILIGELWVKFSPASVLICPVVGFGFGYLFASRYSSLKFILARIKENEQGIRYYTDWIGKGSKECLVKRKPRLLPVSD